MRPVRRPSKGHAHPKVSQRRECKRVALRPKTDEDRASAKQRREAAQSDVLIREIDDAVRQDRYGEVATRYGKPLLALLVVALLALGGYMLWHNRQEAALEADSEALVGALDQLEAGNLDSGDSALDAVIADADGAAATSALMLKGGVAMERGNGADAARIFGEVANDARAPQPLRDLALIRQVSARFDELPPAQVVQQLGSLARPGNASSAARANWSPWRS